MVGLLVVLAVVLLVVDSQQRRPTTPASFSITVTGYPGVDQATKQDELRPVEGVVYLLKAGPFYKIGRAADLDRRLSQIKLQLPYPVQVVHTIATRDPVALEHHWHSVFGNRRTNGEWFVLTDAEVSQFVSREAAENRPV